MITDPFQIMKQVGGQDDRQVAVGYCFTQRGQELPSGQRVEGGNRFVEQEHLRALGQSQAEPDLCPLSTGQRGDGPVRRDSKGREAISSA